MATTVLSDLYDQMRPECPGADDQWLGMGLARAAREFSSKTRCLREVLPVSMVAGQPFYPLTPTNGQEEVGSAVFGALDCNPLKPIAPQDVPNEQGQVCAFWWDPANGLGLWKVPWCSSPVYASLQAMQAANFSGVVLVQIYRVPIRTCTSVSSELLNNEGDLALMDGALAWLLNLKADWRDPVKAQEKHEEFMKRLYTRRQQSDMQYRQWNFRTASES